MQFVFEVEANRIFFPSRSSCLKYKSTFHVDALLNISEISNEKPKMLVSQRYESVRNPQWKALQILNTLFKPYKNWTSLFTYPGSHQNFDWMGSWGRCWKYMSSSDFRNTQNFIMFISYIQYSEIALPCFGPKSMEANSIQLLPLHYNSTMQCCTQNFWKRFTQWFLL